MFKGFGENLKNLKEEKLEKNFLEKKYEDAISQLKIAKDRLDFYRLKESSDSFKQEFPEFGDFLKSKDFSFLISRGCNPTVVNEQDEVFKSLLFERPFREEYSCQGASAGQKGMGIKLIYKLENDIVIREVEQDYKYEEDNLGATPDFKEEKEGKSLADTLKSLDVKSNFVIIKYEYSSYHRGSLTERVENNTLLEDKDEPKKSINLYLVKN